MAGFFNFEADFVDSLRCIPMCVRFKLDTCGIKLQLAHWNQFNTEERQQLVDLPCDTVTSIAFYRANLQQLVIRHTNTPPKELDIDPQPPWLDETQIPAPVIAKLAETQSHLTLDRWASLQPLQRFALIKLSRSSHENSNFIPALREFELFAN
jgi:hypothetical protein